MFFNVFAVIPLTSGCSDILYKYSFFTDLTNFFKFS